MDENAKKNKGTKRSIKKILIIQRVEIKNNYEKFRNLKI
jgi:hypothetical protein